MPPNSTRPWERSAWTPPFLNHLSLALTSQQALPPSFPWKGFMCPAGNPSASSVPSAGGPGPAWKLYLESPLSILPTLQRRGLLSGLPHHTASEHSETDSSVLALASDVSQPVPQLGHPLPGPPQSPGHSPGKPPSLPHRRGLAPFLGTLFCHPQTSDRAVLLPELQSLSLGCDLHEVWDSVKV